jgi:hypothetical protein
LSETTTIDGIDFGPLAALIGVWKGDRGVDLAPEPGGDENSPYYETITFEASGDVTNAERQTLAVVRYHQVVSRKSNGEVFHDQVGYWTWDASDNTLVESFTIPRRVAVIAGGNAAAPGGRLAKVTLDVRAEVGAADFGVLQAPFMLDHAKTLAFTHQLTVFGDEMSYTETTLLKIYDQDRYEHKDSNTLARVG